MPQKQHNFTDIIIVRKAFGVNGKMRSGKEWKRDESADSSQYKMLDLRHVGIFQLQLKPVGDQSDKLAIGGFALRITDCVSEEALQGVQISYVPCHLDGMAVELHRSLRDDLTPVKQFSGISFVGGIVLVTNHMFPIHRNIVPLAQICNKKL